MNKVLSSERGIMKHTRIRRRDGFGRLVAPSLANGRDGDDHHGPHKSDDDGVEDNGVFVRMALLSVELCINKGAS